MPIQEGKASSRIEQAAEKVCGRLNKVIGIAWVALRRTSTLII